MLKFEDFAKLEIKMGTIISAERVANVDLGSEQRQVIAGFGDENATLLLPENSVPNGSKLK